MIYPGIAALFNAVTSGEKSRERWDLEIRGENAVVTVYRFEIYGF